MSNDRQGRYAHEMDAYLLARLHARPMSGSCALCEWTAEGTAGEVLEQSKAHRKEAHGIYRSRSRKPSRGLRSIRTPGLQDYERADIEAEIEKRRRLLGIEEAA